MKKVVPAVEGDRHQRGAITVDGYAGTVKMDIFPFLDELRAIAKNGLLFTQDAYDRARYTRLLELVSQYYGLVLDLPPVEVQQRLRAELGLVTPHVGANAAIFDQHGAILLMQRMDDGGWCLPGGATEVTETPMDTAVREAREETGLDVRAVQLVDLYARPARMEDGVHALVSLVYLCEVVGGTLQCSDEGLGLRYWPIAEVQHWHGVHQRHAEAAYTCWLAQLDFIHLVDKTSKAGYAQLTLSAKKG